MKREDLKFIALEIFITGFFLIILLASKISFNKMLVAILLIVYAYITRKLISRPKQLSIYKKEVRQQGKLPFITDSS